MPTLAPTSLSRSTSTFQAGPARPGAIPSFSSSERNRLAGGYSRLDHKAALAIGGWTIAFDEQALCLCDERPVQWKQPKHESGVTSRIVEPSQLLDTRQSPATRMCAKSRP